MAPLSSSLSYADLPNRSRKLEESESETSDTVLENRDNNMLNFEYNFDESESYELSEAETSERSSIGSSSEASSPLSFYEDEDLEGEDDESGAQMAPVVGLLSPMNIHNPKSIAAVQNFIKATSSIKIKLESMEEDYGRNDNDANENQSEGDDKNEDDGKNGNSQGVICTGDDDKDDSDAEVNCTVKVEEFICNVCGKSWHTLYKLQIHMTRVHDKSDKSKTRPSLKEFCSKFTINDGCLLCDQCNFRCGQFHRFKMVEHYRIHSGEKPYQCLLCEKKWRTKAMLKKHISNVHYGRKSYVCDICGKSFAERRNMNEHLHTHTKEKPFICDLCGVRFTQKSSLNSHKKSHENKRSYQCEICNAAFNTNSVLVRHVRTHSGDKRYRCEQCGKTFFSNDLLCRHKAVHSQETPFQCKLCAARFKLKRYLLQHGKIHEKKS